MLKYAIISGLCASLGSCFGKLPSIVEERTGYSGSALLFLQGACLALMLASNALVWTFFVRSLQSSSTTIATITSTGVNYVITALLGWLVYRETNPLTYWFGISLVITGLAIVNYERERQKTE